ncbi:GH3 auxin-responsive promoter [Chiua virens]|nr:GH3 auxin-responsive promoter [Chiua virens]
MLRRAFGWYTDDDGQLSRSSTFRYAVPWAATVIVHLPSFLIIHGLFFLVHRNLELFHIPYSTTFVDLIRYIDEQWDLLVSSIRDGTVPTTLEGIEHVRVHLQVRSQSINMKEPFLNILMQTHLVADPDRAAELLDIGPPSSQEGWLTRVWPNTKQVVTMRFILGPKVTIRSPGYFASEISLGLPPNDTDKLDEFPLRILDVVEFLDVSQDEKHQNLCQAWEVEVGKKYEPVITTRDGLWRYQLGDVVEIIGFDNKNSVPVFKHFGRRSLTLRFTDRQITDGQLLAVVEGVSSDDVIRVLEFTTVMDDRTLPHAVGFFVELAGPLGQRFFDALVATNAEHRRAHDLGRMSLPTIRIVRPGTFTEYRHWKAEIANVGSGQIKVPPVLHQPNEQDWIVERVVQEL